MSPISVSDDEKCALVRSYAEAKSRQDVAGALGVCHPCFGIETLPFGTESRDRDESRVRLGLFFSVFPDYRADTEGLAAGDGCVAWWGTITLSFEGPLLGVAPTGRTATLPACSVFEFHEGRLAKERFCFDLVTLCEGIGASLEDVRDALAGLRAAAA